MSVADALAIPELPPATTTSEEAWGTAEVMPRYEDITQDGRVVLTALMQGLGASVWRGMLERHPAIAHLRAQAILPILRRVVVVGEDGPFAVDEPIAYRGTWRLAREEGGDRLLLNMWVDAHARSATTFGPPPAEGAERVRVGRVFAEHVITKPFAPKEERKVTRLEAPGLPAVPEATYRIEPTEALLALRGDAPLVPAGEVVFGKMHTDSNQHVNSLVYPRLFEEALVRRGAGGPGAGGRSAADRLVRAVEMRWRKPCFAGDRVPLTVAVREGRGGEEVAVGAFGSPEAPHCTLAARLR